MLNSEKLYAMNPDTVNINRRTVQAVASLSEQQHFSRVLLTGRHHHANILRMLNVTRVCKRDLTSQTVTSYWPMRTPEQ